MPLDSPSKADNSGTQTDSLLQQAVGDLQAGELNNKAFARDISYLYARDQGDGGNPNQFNNDLIAINQQLKSKNILPNLVLVGEDGQDHMIYDDPTSQQIKVVDIDSNVIDSGSEQEMLVKLGVQQAQPNAADQGGAGNDQSGQPSQSPGDVPGQSGQGQSPGDGPGQSGQGQSAGGG